MAEDSPFVLDYAAPKRGSRFAYAPVFAIVLVAIVVPGLSSSIIRGSPRHSIYLVLALAAAFGIFGPLWAEVLFTSRSVSELGLYPFILTCVTVEVVSVVQALKARNDVRGNLL